MARPYNTLGRMTVMSILAGKEVDGNTPRWMDRKHGWTPKKSKGGNTKRQKKK